MGEPFLDVEAVKASLEQGGLLGMLPDEDVARFNAALTALGEQLLDPSQLALPDARLEEYRGWAERLLLIFDGFAANHAIVGDTVRFSVCWSWWVTLNRQAKALRCLYDAGLAGDAVPLLRSITEYALWCVALSWDDGPLLASIMRAADDEDKKLINSLPLQLPAEVMALVNSIPRVDGEGSPAKSFMAVCRTLGVNATVLPLWRFLSSLSHPTTAVAYFLTMPSVEGLKVNKTPGLPGLSLDILGDQAVAMLVQCLLWAGFSIDRLIDGHPLRTQLQEIADEAKVTELRPPSPTGGSGPAIVS